MMEAENLARLRESQTPLLVGTHHTSLFLQLLTTKLSPKIPSMETTPELFFFFSLLFFSIPISAQTNSNSDSCPDSFCNRLGPVIQFPFRLSDRQHNDRCGYPGFDLSCNTLGLTVLDLPNSGQFLVRDINYITQRIHLYDKDNCIPERLLSLNLSGSPFTNVYSETYTFINCSSQIGISLSDFIPIPCLSDEFNSTVLATTLIGAARSLVREKRCELIQTILVPIPWPIVDYGLYFGLGNDLHLTWGEPSCGYCASRDAKCGFQSNSSTEIGCIDVRRRGLSNAVRYVIILGVGIPALVCVIAVACYVCARVRNARGGGTNRRRDHGNYEFSSAISPQPVVVMVGLDEPTIDSYPKTILGGSRRLLKPEDNICSICLSEYKPKEELRTIPDCKHSFHTNCIDEWLRRNATCPICRNSPISLHDV